MNQTTTQDQQRWVWPFELREKLGEGGMGVVYRARYVKNDRQFAVKLLPSDVTDEVILARFERELEILKTLRHPNIVRCFGGVCENRRRFYAMELVEGGTLEDLIEAQGRLPPMQVVEHGLQMCSALAYAHERGVIHRDIKPGNFLIAQNGQLKLSDFGLASVEAARKITQAGKTMGTYRYMSPEQIRGKAEAKTDLYALGCVLFEMVTGRPPFEGDTPAEILQKHMKEPPRRVSTLVPTCPPVLDQVIADLLEKEPDQRPESATEVARRLREATEVVRVEKPHALSPGAISSRPTPSPARDQKATPASRAISTPLWAWAAGVIVLTGLLVWNLSLAGARAAFRQSESLWIDAYRSGAPGVQIAAAEALGKLGQHSDRAVETLRDGLKAVDPTVRQATVRALGEVGDKDLIPDLIKVQREDTEPQVTTEATAAVTKLRAAERRGSSLWPYLVLAGAVAAGVVGFLWLTRRGTRA